MARIGVFIPDWLGWFPSLCSHWRRMHDEFLA
jgi:hypothetical protein